MDKKEKIELIMALEKAYVAFGRSMKDSGYRLGECNFWSRDCAIYPLNSSPENNWPLGKVVIKWELKSCEDNKEGGYNEG